MKNKGYTLPELIIIIAGLGIVSAIVLFKISTAFSSDNTDKIMEENYFLIEKQAKVYGEKNKNSFNETGELYIMAKDLVEAKLLPVEDNKILSCDKDLSNIKIKLTLQNDAITAKIIG